MWKKIIVCFLYASPKETFVYRGKINVIRLVIHKQKPFGSMSDLVHSVHSPFVTPTFVAMTDNVALGACL